MSQVNTNAIYDASGGQSAKLYGVSMRNGGTAFVNRIINGDMRIDQRNAGASVTQTASRTYAVDRFSIDGSVTSKFTAQQSSVAPSGFTNSLLLTSLAATSVGASDYYYAAQLIEGNNISDLGWGTASAQAATLSFWVRSSLTGTFGGAIRNSAANRSYPFTYTINAANTWEYKTVAIAGETTGTWVTNSGIGLNLAFGLGVGSTFSGTAGSWASANYISATGATSVVGTSGATFYITGVQLEAGTVATPFERRDYGRELMMCQRYYEKSYSIGTVPGAATADGAQVGSGPQGTGTVSEVNAGTTRYKVSKRATPTTTIYDLVGNGSKCTRVLAGTSLTDNQTVTVNSNNSESFYAYSGGGSSATGVYLQYTASAEL